MASNKFLPHGWQVSVIAPSGGVSSGDYVQIGAVGGVAQFDAEAGDPVTIDRVGGYTLPKKAHEVIAADAALYYDPSDGAITAVGTGLKCIGHAHEAAAADDETVQAVLDPVPLVAMNPGDITGVTAGTGLTGGGTSGDVTLGVDFGSGSGKVCEGDDTRLTDERDPVDGSVSETKLKPMTAATDGVVGVGAIVVKEVNCEAASATHFVDAFPYDALILDVIAYCTAANAGGTAQLSYGGNNVTDAIDMAVADTPTHAATINNTYRLVPAGTNMLITKNDAGDDGKVYILAIPMVTP